MADQNHKHHGRNLHHHQYHQYGWSPFNGYQGYDYEAIEEPGIRRSFDSPRHHQRGHMGFKSYKKEGVADAEASSLAETERALERLRHRDHNSNEDVDQEAEDFIKLEHKRICLTKLMSMRPG